LNKRYLLALFGFTSITGIAQIKGDIFSFNYTLAPISSDDIEYSKTDFKFNFPLKLKKGVLLNYAGFDYYQIGYDNINFVAEDISQFYEVSYGLTYRHPIGEKWRLSARGGVSMASNFTNTLTKNDIGFRGGLTALKRLGSKETSSMFMFGLDYTALSGKPRILPMLSYTKRVNDKFSYGIGFPNTSVEYKLNDKSGLKTSLWMNGFYANLSEQFGVTMTDVADKVSFSTVSLELEYSYWMDRMWAITFKGGYSLRNEYQLLDNNNSIVYDFELRSKPYFSAGIKFNIKNRNQIKNNNGND